jgi:oligopeptide/dipeptide ABC transporter ATP-binding protein
MTAPPAGTLLALRDVRVRIRTRRGTIVPVDGVSLDVARGEVLALVGESGCGKSLTALTILRLLDPPVTLDPASRIVFEGTELTALPERELRRVRGRRIGMVFQEPMTALNPVHTVGAQVAEVVLAHERVPRAEAWARAVRMLEAVGIPDPAVRARQYPHELSGGMRQRVMLAIALVLDPALLVADEPTTALDVTIQAQLLDLLREAQRARGASVLLITHDLGVVAETAQRVAVMYAGQVVEEAPVQALFAAPLHPYTEGLLAAMPRAGTTRRELATIPGTVPPPEAWPTGCRFAERCPYMWERCTAEAPPLHDAGDGRRARCHLVEEPARRAARHLPLAAARP